MTAIEVSIDLSVGRMFVDLLPYYTVLLQNHSHLEVSIKDLLIFILQNCVHTFL